MPKEVAGEESSIDPSEPGPSVSETWLEARNSGKVFTQGGKWRSDAAGVFCHGQAMAQSICVDVDVWGQASVDRKIT